MASVDSTLNQLANNDLAALWREYQAADREYAAVDLEPDDSPAWGRFLAADDTIAAARPTDPLGMATQCRWLADQAEGSPCRLDRAEVPVLISIARRLEAMAADG